MNTRTTVCGSATKGQLADSSYQQAVVQAVNGDTTSGSNALDDYEEVGAAATVD